MKVVATSLLQKKNTKKIGRYLITLEVTDTDINTLEDFATTNAPFQLHEDFKNRKITYEQFMNEVDKLDYSDKYQKWILKFFNCFHKLWREYD